MPPLVDLLPNMGQDGGMPPVGAVKAVQTVAVIVQDHAEPFGLG